MGNEILSMDEVRKKEGFTSEQTQAVFPRLNPEYLLIFINPESHYYEDSIKRNGSVIEYMGEGTRGDQVPTKYDGSPNSNGDFINAAYDYLSGKKEAKKVKVYKKTNSTTLSWECLGFYRLIGCWKQPFQDKEMGIVRKVYKFLLNKN